MGTPPSKHPSTLTKGTCVFGLHIQWWLEIHEALGSYSTGVHHRLVSTKKQIHFFCHSIITYCVYSQTRTRLLRVTCQKTWPLGHDGVPMSVLHRLTYKMSWQVFVYCSSFTHSRSKLALWYISTHCKAVLQCACTYYKTLQCALHNVRPYSAHCTS